jgi:hypothetical protein
MGANRIFKVKTKVLVEIDAIIEISSLTCPSKEEVLKAIQSGFRLNSLEFGHLDSNNVIDVISDSKEIE